MSGEWGLLAVAALVFVYALLGRRLSDSILTAPMLFLFAGWGFQTLGLVELAMTHTVFTSSQKSASSFYYLQTQQRSILGAYGKAPPSLRECSSLGFHLPSCWASAPHSD